MKKYRFLLLLCSLQLFACSKSGTDAASTKTALTGTWKLVETLADPGDGSGTWRPVTGPAQTTIRFNTDGSLQGNAFPQAKTYTVLDETRIQFTYADGTFINYMYACSGAKLMLSGGGCIEACGAKFIKEIMQQP